MSKLDEIAEILLDALAGNPGAESRRAAPPASRAATADTVPECQPSLPNWRRVGRVVRGLASLALELADEFDPPTKPQRRSHEEVMRTMTPESRAAARHQLIRKGVLNPDGSPNRSRSKRPPTKRRR